jgi:hypothetical protein
MEPNLFRNAAHSGHSGKPARRHRANIKDRAASLLLALLLGVAPAFAQASVPESDTPRFVSLTIENDFFAGFDRHYTNGVQAAFLVGLDDLPEKLRTAPPFSWSTDPGFVVALGQRMFTPSRKELDTPDPTDRPYAGWLYLMMDMRVQSGSVVDHLSANVGMVGPASGARQTQDTFHHLIGEDAAHGWNTQIRNQATGMLAYERAWSSPVAGRFNDRHYDVTPRVGAAVGNVLTYANAGMVLRYGSELPVDLPATHISLGPPRDGYRGAAQFGWYTWVGFDARAVARNIFLDDSASHVQRRPYGHDVDVGVTLVWPRARFGFALVQRSGEFYGQDKPDRFGQLTLSFAQ